MKRRFLILVLGLVGLVSQAEKPNVLFIASDDLNDWVGALGGHPQAKTPNIDRLMKRGVMFRNAHCAAPACNPSRVALMTGLRPSTTGIYLNSNPWRPVLPDAVTLPQHFSRNGYVSGGAGKIYHGRYEDDASWDHYLRKGSDPKPTPQVAKDKRSRAGGVLDAGDQEMNDYKMVSYCIDQLGKKHDRPFFLACGIYRPHMPWQVPRKYYDMFPADGIELPEHLQGDLKDVPSAGVSMARPGGDHATMLKTGNWKYAVQGYLASMAFTDAMVGRLMDAFNKSAHTRNTIIVFWTDHGWHLGEKEHWRKFALWEEATHVPLMIAAPGVSQTGKVSDQPVNLIDLYPTLIDLCGLPKRAELDGRSLVPLLREPNAEWGQPSLTTHGRNNHGLRSQRYRLIQYANGDRELYDHQKDPMEYANLAGKAKYAGVIKDLLKWLPKDNVPEAPRDKNLKKRKKPKK